MALRAFCVLALGLALGCASAPVSVRRADPRDVQRELTANVLTNGRLSARTHQFLERYALARRFAADPVGTLAEIHRGLLPEGDEARLSALAELSFQYADRSGDRRYYGLAALYAYALLFPGPGGETLDASDPRVRLAYDLYNRGLTGALALDERGRLSAQSGTRQLALPIGTLDVDFPEDELVWAGHRLRDLVPASNYEVTGFRDRYRVPGLGAALAAELGPEIGGHEAEAERFMPGLRVPVTLVIRIDDPRRGLVTGRLRGRAELYTPDESLSVSIDGRDVPVEFETTSALAAALADSPFWSFELRGFFSGALKPFRQAVTGTDVVAAPTADQGLLFLSPHRPGRIPLVLVHGTASSPGRWADLVNELENDRQIWSHYEIWLFIYNTGNPIGYSGRLLRKALERAVAELDPTGADPALRRMVVVGHSQGGLLTKLLVVDSGDRFWRLLSKVSPDELELSPEVRRTLVESTFFTPEPFVKRVVFVCTPHHGSYLTALRLVSLSPAAWISGLVAMPSNLIQVTTELLTRNEDKLMLRGLRRLPTSIDNMTPGNPFLRVLAGLPIAPGVAAHSIIAVRGPGPPEGQSDGVVSYESAHLDGVESELVVRSSHSAQGQPRTIEEIRRILIEHLAAR